MKNNNLIFNSDIKIKSYIELSGIAFPLNISIDKIKDESFYAFKEDYFYKIKTEGELYSIDQKSPSFIYGKFKDVDSSYKMLSIIYDFIDNELIIDSNGNTILQVLKLSTKKEFVSFIMNSGIINFSNMIDIYNELLFYIEKVKNIFIDNMISTLNFDKKFPRISIKERDSDIPKDLISHASYTVGMVDIQSIIEFGTNMIYKENVGKAYEEWSWREKYVRKMYLDLKSRTDEYIEKLKMKQMETV